METLFLILGYMICHWKAHDELYDLRYQNTLLHRVSKLLWEKYHVKQSWSNDK